jgi:predicted O-linked N-acetylglucosamine transferase (SPINDLY family)
MTANFSGTSSFSEAEQALQFLWEGNYPQAALLYEQAILSEPYVKSNYWHLGLMLLLQGQEEEAMSTWLLGMVDGTPEQVELWTAELLAILEQAAIRLEASEDNNLLAWLIRGHIREIAPTDWKNLIPLVQLAIALKKFTAENIQDWGIIEILNAEQVGNLDAEQTDELLQILEKVLKIQPLHQSTTEFARSCLPHLQQHPQLLSVLLPAAIEIGHLLLNPSIAASLLELCVQVDPDNPEICQTLAGFYQNAGEYDRGIELAEKCYSLVQTLPEKICHNHLLLRGLMSAGGYWEEICAAISIQESLLLALTREEVTKLDSSTVERLLCADCFFPYFRDRSQENRQIINQLSQQCQANFQSYAREQVQRYSLHFVKRRNLSTVVRNKRLKVGYISHYLRSHSVGWLARWLLAHHDRDRLEIHLYLMLYQDIGDPLQDWYVNQAEYCHKLGANSGKIADQIYEDEIDILVDLDSLTLNNTCKVMALKPAPIQVTWLGWDASGLPAIDYFIADPYVLPENAQEYYQEKIWRLPQTYIAVDGFEVGVPSLRREDLNIPDDAIVYYSGQRGYKRHPDTARLQMRIIKEVPNSYFLIKGLGDEEAISNFFTELAASEGVQCDRLRFLPIVAEESVHRANLGIADVVLDTYPYNGATTTLETLWMGIPLVTRVGEQFAARNSYTMMMNAGITEGIAWSDEEYVQWGIRLGKNPDLRKHISWKLWRSRQTSPLWNAEQFTREMEKAYEQMWANFINKPH